MPNLSTRSTVATAAFVPLPSAKRTLSFGLTFSSLVADNALSASLNALSASAVFAKPTFQPDSWIAVATVLPVTKPEPLFLISASVTSSGRLLAVG